MNGTARAARGGTTGPGRRAWRLLLLALALSACTAAPQAQEPQDVDDGLHPLWPPTGQTRIVHRQNIRGASEGDQSNPLARLGSLIAGPRRQRLSRPQAIARGGDNLYIVDQELQGVHVLPIGSGKTQFIDRADKMTFFVSPVGVAWCGSSLAVSDSALKQVFILSPGGKLIRKLNKPDGFGRPTGLAYDTQNQLLYVVDTLASVVCVFDEQGQYLRSIGGDDSPVGFHYPTYAAVGPDGKLYVTDTLNFRLQVISPEEPMRLLEIGKLGNASGYLAVPKGVGVDRFGHIYIVDSYFSAVQIFSDKGEFLLSFGQVGTGSGQFVVPTGLLVTPDDNRIYVCDSQNARVQVFDYVGETP
jgi:DNA-binding beta-propeller fold protein YncE